MGVQHYEENNIAYDIRTHTHTLTRNEVHSPGIPVSVKYM